VGVATSDNGRGYGIESLTYSAEEGVAPPSLPPSPAPPPPPSPAPPKSSGFVTTTEVALAMPVSGYVSKLTLTHCTLSGTWMGRDRPLDGVVVASSNVGSDGIGTYWCSIQTRRHLKMVQFELKRTSTGQVTVKALGAGYVSSGDAGVASSETNWSKKRNVGVATSDNGRGYGIESLTYSAEEGVAPTNEEAELIADKKTTNVVAHTQGGEAEDAHFEDEEMDGSEEDEKDDEEE